MILRLLTGMMKVHPQEQKWLKSSCIIKKLNHMSDHSENLQPWRSPYNLQAAGQSENPFSLQLGWSVFSLSSSLFHFVLLGRVRGESSKFFFPQTCDLLFTSWVSYFPFLEGMFPCRRNYHRMHKDLYTLEKTFSLKAKEKCVCIYLQVWWREDIKRYMMRRTNGDTIPC